MAHNVSHSVCLASSIKEEVWSHCAKAWTATYALEYSIPRLAAKFAEMYHTILPTPKPVNVNF